MTTNVRHPNVRVTLSGTNGNAFAVLGKVVRAMRKMGVAEDEIAEFQTLAKSGNYDTLLQTCMTWVTVK